MTNVMLCTSNKKQNGGARQGSGAKLKYKEKTVTVSFRVPISKAETIKTTINELLTKYRNEATN